MYFPRKLLSKIEECINSRQIIVVTGMRRVGKTTLLRMVFDSIEDENKAFLDIENPLDQAVFEEIDYNNILANLKEYKINLGSKIYLFLDEIQAMPEIVKAIKYLYDHYDIKFFVTGSSSFYLKNLFPESLAGRKFIFELFPLDFEEFLVFKDLKTQFHSTFKNKDLNKNLIKYEHLKKLYDEYIEFGGFPQVVVADGEEEKNRQLEDIFKSYFEKEVKILSDFKQVNVLRDLLLLLISRSGSKLEVGKLASEVGVSRETVNNYLAFLQGTYFIDLIVPFSRSVDREVSGTKKVYVCDTGVVRAFARVHEGSLFENAVYNNLKKYGKIFYYQKRSGAEIDFILEDEKTALEVKQIGDKRDLDRLKKISKLLKIKSAFVITRAFNKEPGFVPAIEL